ncbi:hypothetical protein ASD15_07455 [Massilia sp. Root351]|jgi:hypothetical protein|uniref:hypothetical protein n=1 Tax=Massilia sp. Root351 TaxID=1736522 RepID=UPI00070941D7|nr:hypothetical protein [Massilia sp. Root351]KQV84964.1 hypothetical protein ASD15_07455 [Massilia sp. Root351]
MSSWDKHQALLMHLGGPHLPPLSLNISAQYQPCVDAGVAAAVCFFDDMTSVGLHDHIALSMHEFMVSVRAGMRATKTVPTVAMQGCTDAFAAGYLGRIQQELRLFHDDGLLRSQEPTFSSRDGSH